VLVKSNFLHLRLKTTLGPSTKEPPW